MFSWLTMNLQLLLFSFIFGEVYF